MNTPKKRNRSASGPRSRFKVRCKCEYCVKSVPLLEREMVFDGQQCAEGWRLELTGDVKTSASDVGRSEFLSIGQNYGIRAGI